MLRGLERNRHPGFLVGCGPTDEDAMHKLQYDLYYVKNHSLFLDLMILFQTAQVVLWGKGVR